MGGVDKLFGILLIVIIVAAASFVVVDSFVGPAGAPAPAPSSAAPSSSSSIPTVSLASGPRVNERCECYNQAVSVAQKEDLNVRSPLYEAGFRDCYKRLGQEGGDYWTAGWRARSDNPRRPQSCRAYQATLD